MFDYIKLEYQIKFERKVFWNKTPSIIFRSVLGAQLKKITCVLKNNKCQECVLKDNCVYACFFETPIDKNHNILLGRDKAPHPFTLNVVLINDISATVEIVFIGKSKNYIPYITLALERAGCEGVSKSRTLFKIINIKNNNSSFNFDIKTISDLSKKWPFDTSLVDFNKIKFLTPCRIKKQGHYLDNILANDFVIAMERRISILDKIYGDGTFVIKDIEPDIISYSLNQKWVDLNYYSSRQKTALKIGGVVGELLIPNEVDKYYLQIFQASEIFNIGKNISMGLGKIILLKEE
ncbi:MAG: CRISPR system precrRNA processing endoribonuclease RAMP protein Cas6 [Spirochaetia bacterium]|nr:CRISPR system precrRNA processing endoribonuclease RAMP protein Cas6 [Spirochaetia bacterium]